MKTEETTLLRTLYSAGGSDDAPGNCMECGLQISSEREIEYPKAIFCAECAAKLVEPGTCGKGSD